MQAGGFIDFRCSACGQAVRLPAGAAGQEATCPVCRAEVRVPETSDAPPPLGLFWGGDVPPPRPETQPPVLGPRVLAPADLPAWRVVSVGLLLESLAALALLLLAVVLFLAGCLLRRILGEAPHGPLTPAPVVVLGVGCVVLGSVALGLVGRCLMCFVPAVPAARVCAVGSFLLVLLGQAALIAALVLRRPDFEAVALSDGLGILGLAASLVGHVLFLLFLASVARHLRDPLGGRLVAYFVCSLVFPAVVLVGFALLEPAVAEAHPESLPFVAFLRICGWEVVLVALLIWHRRLVGQVREDIEQNVRWSRQGPPA
jgi:hypothetical protein